MPLLKNVCLLLTILSPHWTVLIDGVQYEPYMIAVLTRHGIRNPTRINFHDSDKKVNKGELTEGGQHQMYQMGARYRELYPNLFLPPYSPQDYFVQASRSPRTIQSAESFLIGLYPPGTGPSLPVKDTTPGIDLNPPFAGFKGDFHNQSALPEAFNVPVVQSRYEKNKVLFKVAKYCKQTLAEVKKYQMKSSNRLQAVLKKVAEESLIKFQKMNPSLRKQLENPTLATASRLFDHLNSYQYINGKPYPNVTADFFSTLTSLHTLKVLSKAPTRDLQLMMTDHIVRDLVTTFDDKLYAKHILKIKVYSGHDSNLVPFLRLLGLMSEKCILDKIANAKNTTKEYLEAKELSICEETPSFAAAFTFELLTSATSPNSPEYFRLLFNEQPVRLCHESDYCRWNIAKQRLLGMFTAGDFDSICKGKIGDGVLKANVDLITMFFFVIVICSIILAVWTNYRKRELRTPEELEEEWARSTELKKKGQKDSSPVSTRDTSDVIGGDIWGAKEINLGQGFVKEIPTANEVKLSSPTNAEAQQKPPTGKIKIEDEEEEDF